MRTLKELVLGAGLACLIASGCSMNYISFERYCPNSPLVVVSDGLFSGDARSFFKKFSRKENLPYLGEDNVCWFKNKQAIQEAKTNGREIILVGYSAGCDQVRLTAEWCKENNIPVRIIFFDPTYLSLSNGNSIPENVRSISNYLSQRNIADIVAIGKGREIRKTDLRNPNTEYSNYELEGPHLGIFNNNQPRLKKDLVLLMNLSAASCGASK